MSIRRGGWLAQTGRHPNSVVPCRIWARWLPSFDSRAPSPAAKDGSEVKGSPTTFFHEDDLAGTVLASRLLSGHLRRAEEAL